MTDSYTAELRDMIDRAFVGEHHGRATATMVHASVQRNLPDHLLDYLIAKGLRSQITAYFNAKSDDGLPKRPEVNRDGEHAQLELLSVEEFGYLHAAYVSRADANRQQAERVRERCYAAYGVDLALVAV